MSSRRVLKAAQAIREVVSMAIIAELKDPRIADVTVTFVEVSADLRHSKVHVSVMGDETKKRLCIQGLQSAAGYLQKKVGDRIDTRYTPRIRFELDKGLENSMLVTKILDEVLPKEDESAAADANAKLPPTPDPDRRESDGKPSDQMLPASVDDSVGETEPDP